MFISRSLLFFILCLLLLPISFLIHFLFARPGLVDNLDDLEIEHRSNNLSRKKEKNDRTIIVAGAWRAPPVELVKQDDESKNEKNNNGKPSTSCFSFLPPLFIPQLPPDYSHLEIETLTKAFQLRLDKAVEIAVKYEIPRIIFTGAIGDAAVSRAYVMWKYAEREKSRKLSIAEQREEIRKLERDEDRIVISQVKLSLSSNNNKTFPVDLIIETKSRTTEENAIFSKKILFDEVLMMRTKSNDENNDGSDGDDDQEQEQEHTIIAITTPGHLRRTRMYFGREFLHKNDGDSFSTKIKTKFNLKMIGSDRDMFEWRFPRGIFLHPADLPDAKAYHDFCFTSEKSKLAKFFRFLRDKLWVPEKGILDVVCCMMASFRHHQSRLAPTLQSINVTFEIREVLGIFANWCQGKLSWREIYEFW